MMNRMFNPFHRFRIDYVLFFVFAGFVTVLITLVMVISYTLSAGSQTSSTFHYQQGMLNKVSKELNAQLRSVEQASLALSLNQPFLNYLALTGDYYTRNWTRIEVNQNYLTPVVNSSTLLQSIQVYMNDPTLTDVNADVQFLPRSMLSKEPWYAAAEKSDALWVGEHSVGSGQGTVPVVSFVRRLTTQGGAQQLGMLVLNVKLKALQATLNEDQQGASRLLVDSGGRLLFSTASAPRLPAISGLLEQIDADSGYRRVRLGKEDAPGGSDMLMVWTRDFREGWLLVELTPYRDIMRSSVKLAGTLAAVGAAALVVASFVTLYLSRLFTAPVRELLALMNAYSLNRTMREFPSRYRNEFGSLFIGYRRLIERVEELYVSLERQYKAQREAEIRALQAMINPHFLYNTLDQLNWMAIEAGQERISEVLELMGRMFRIGLSGGASFITLQDELLHTECYLRIQQLKWGHGLQYAIEGAAPFADCYIPKLTLQPFVENAVLHGFHGRSGGRIAIKVEAAEEGLCIRIADDGKGLAPDWNVHKRRKKGGYGIRNVMERIEAYFGAPYGVRLRTLPDGAGTEVEIRIPLLAEMPDAGAAHGAEERSDSDVDDRGRR
ncbi:cache domain-containing sensor histidine kinase [Gordoniibacillus kamchatkensis]|uniref:cache domain-containing sensor histidine kinase n=1 Tax=Gordoniibacillus kamchatkensis TaxID=1590651 RepID=UPI000AC3A1C4|nr:sensor histidine kinase [Paenibacillus sp. VKM B-2647]